MGVDELPESSEHQRPGSCLMLREKIQRQDERQAGKCKVVKVKVHIQEGNAYKLRGRRESLQLT